LRCGAGVRLRRLVGLRQRREVRTPAWRGEPREEGRSWLDAAVHLLELLEVSYRTAVDLNDHMTRSQPGLAKCIARRIDVRHDDSVDGAFKTGAPRKLRCDVSEREPQLLHHLLAR